MNERIKITQDPAMCNEENLYKIALSDILISVPLDEEQLQKVNEILSVYRIPFDTILT